MQPTRILLGVLALTMASCGGGSAGTTTANDFPPPTAAHTTTSIGSAGDITTTRVLPPATTEAPTTTTTGLRLQVQDVTVGPGGESDEVVVTWVPNPEEDRVAWYNVYYSSMPGGAKNYVRSVNPPEMIGDRVGFIDQPRSQTSGQTCYVVYARKPSGEGPPSLEACFDPEV